MWAKCINISDDKQYFRIKYGDGTEETLSRQILKSGIQEGSIGITNLDDNLNINIDIGLKNYSLLDSNISLDKCKKAYDKSTILGVSPNVRQDKKDDSLIVVRGDYDEIYITDYTRVIDPTKTINANKITFIGDKALQTISVISSIRCSKAIILNKCVLSNIFAILSNDLADVAVRTKVIELKNDFIDVNTVLEMHRMLTEARYRYEQNHIKSKFHLIKTHFKEKDIENVQSKMFSMLLYIQKHANKDLEIVKNTSKEDNKYNSTVLKYMNKYCANILFIISMIESLKEYNKQIICNKNVINFLKCNMDILRILGGLINETSFLMDDFMIIQSAPDIVKDSAGICYMHTGGMIL